MMKNKQYAVFRIQAINSMFDDRDDFVVMSKKQVEEVSIFEFIMHHFTQMTPLQSKTTAYKKLKKVKLKYLLEGESEHEFYYEDIPEDRKAIPAKSSRDSVEKQSGMFISKRSGDDE